MPVQLIREFNRVSKIFLEFPRSLQNAIFLKYRPHAFDADFYENANDRQRKRKLFVLLYDFGIQKKLMAEIEREYERHGLQKQTI